LVLDRYSINENDYLPGSSSYIIPSSVYTKVVGSSNFSNYTLGYYDNDIYLMSSSTNNFDFFKIKDLNRNTTTGHTVTLLNTETRSKVKPWDNGNPRSFGIVGNKIYIVTNKSVLVSRIGFVEEPPVYSTDLGYKNSQFNGNVFSKESLSDGFMFNPSSAKYRGSYVTSGSFTSSLKFKNRTNVSFNYPDTLYTNLIGFTNFNGTNFRKYNFLYENVSTNDRTPLASSQYTTLNPNSPTENKFEIINISKGKGLKIDLTNQNLAKSFNKYILINSDSGNSSRINFYLDCRSADYSLICSGTKFNFKGAVLGQFYISGSANTLISDKRFIRIHENADLLINLTIDLKNRKYQSVSSTLIHLKYE
jgi:hypothetical protein